VHDAGEVRIEDGRYQAECFNACARLLVSTPELIKATNWRCRVG